MRYLLRITFLIIIMSLTTVTASADKYSRAWKKVEKLINEDLPESAAKEIDHIWDMAAKDKDGRQMLKSAVYLTQVRQTYDEKSITDGIELFNTLLPTLRVQEHKALCHAFLANGYMKYWSKNRYNSARRLPSDEENPPLDHWTPRMICDTICHHLDQSIKLAGDVGSGFYEEFFPGGNKAGQKLRPLLVDMLMDNAITLITDYKLPLGRRHFFDDPRLYGSMLDFLEATRDLTPDDPDLWQFYVLMRLIQHNYGAKPDIRCTIDIRRMSVLNDYIEEYEWGKNDDEWIKGALALAESYSKKVKFSTMFYSMAATKIVDGFDGDMIPEDRKDDLIRQAHDICVASLKKWPKSEGAFECMALRAEMERPNVSFEFNQDFLPGERNVARLDYRNVNTVYIKVVEVPGRLTADNQVDMLSQLSQCSAVAEWSMRVNDPGDYQDHYTLINIPPLMQGCYYMMVSSGRYFNSGDCIAYKYVECNSIQFVRLIQDNGAVHGVAVNVRTGKPVPDCKYTLWRLNSSGDQAQISTTGITSADGSIDLQGYYGRFKLEMECGSDRGNVTLYTDWRYDTPAQGYYIRLYTDRFTYLPGDSVQFTGIVYTRSSEKGHVMPDAKVYVYVEGSGDMIEVGSYISDEMGVIKGSYKIPDNYMPGRLYFTANLPEQSVTGNTSVNVESFRQPKFKVEFDECEDEVFYDTPVTITGSAMSYTGVPVDGANVEWFAGVSSYQCHRFCIIDKRGYVRVGAGQVKTAEDGTFSISLSIPKEIMIQDRGMVHVEAIVTDVNGETHETSLEFNVAQKQNRHINISSPQNSVIDKNGQKSFSFMLVSGNGPVSGRINVKVARLVWVEKPGLPLPFNTFTDGWQKSEKKAKELSQNADNMNLKERFPLYDFDLTGENIVETTVFEGVVPYDRDDPKSMELILDGLVSGVYRVYADAPGFEGVHSDYTLCREDDYDFVPLKPLLWGYDENGRIRSVELGDTARIRLGNSRKGSLIHYFIENKYGLVSKGIIESNGHQQVLSIPVTKDLLGTFSVNCCVVYEGVAENNSFLFEVPDRSKQLKMKLVTFRSLLEPDVDEEWKLTITDWFGNPVKAAVMLDMYDRALDVYGFNNFRFYPYNGSFVAGHDLMQTRNDHTSQYQPWAYSFDDGKYEYKGKRAITGMLINPFEYRPRIKLSDFEGLGITTVDEALQGRVPGLDIVFNSGDLGARSTMRLRGSANVGSTLLASESIIDNGAHEPESIPMRTDLNPTGLFEYLVTDSTGTATVHFRTPQLLTEWNVKGLSFTDTLQSAFFDTTLITRKQIMVEPASPRFLREGDRLEFTVKVSNLTEKSTKATVTMTIADAVTGRALGIIEGGNKKNVTIPAGGSAGTSFTIKVPSGLTAVTYRLIAEAPGHNDGMEETIPVLSNRTQVVQSLSLFNNGAEKRSFHIEVLDRPRSTTMADEKLTVEYSATPIWYAIQSLPVMIRFSDMCNLCFFYSMMGSAISQDLCRRYPVIREMLDEWKELPVSAWQAQLERNEDLTGTLLEETPWVMDNRSENDRLHELARMLGYDETREAFEYALGRLIATQEYDGGWAWWPGFKSNMHVTDEIMQGLALLIENGIIDETLEVHNMIQKGLNYIDAYFYKKYDVKEKPQSLGYEELNYLILRSYFQSYDFRDKTPDSYKFYTSLADKEETYDLDIYYRAQLALLMSRTGKKERAEHIAATLLERSLYSDEMGRYWRDNVGGLMWYEAPIETQSLIIRVLLAVGRDAEAVKSARWLLKQKQTTGWGSSPATAAAVTALMATGANAHLESDPDITIYVGKEAVQASTSKATAGFTSKSWNGPISRDKADITVDAKTAGISWGAVYRTFTETLDKVEHQENGMNLKRTIWRIIHGADGDRLEEVKAGTVLHVGDQVRIRFELTTDRNLEYLQLADMRAATAEPLSTRAGYVYNWRDGIGYYIAPNNTRNVFYIDYLSKGSYVIEYDVKIQKPGKFTVGNAVMQCLYAPTFRATTTSATFTVQE